ncbi:MAG: hypothetical protein LBU39_01635 [Desulfobulbaceae bacterium]|jgi:hypothetical protein|nr:hypothetical protein [Desulfobulbaceae bacterium]
MRYIRIILALLALASLITVFYLWPRAEAPKRDVVATINGYQLEKSELTASPEEGDGDQRLEDLINSAITRELLIQEAQRQKIDKEEAFRKSLKAFYEQSLLKILMDRKYAAFNVTTSDEEIDRYLSLFGKMIRFTRLPVRSEPPYKPVSDQGQSTEVLFDDLADSMKPMIAGLKPGEYVIKFDTGHEQYALRLDAVTASSTTSQTPAILPREMAKSIIEQSKKERLISEWLTELRQNANITIHN